MDNYNNNEQTNNEQNQNNITKNCMYHSFKSNSNLILALLFISMLSLIVSIATLCLTINNKQPSPRHNRIENNNNNPNFPKNNYFKEPGDFVFQPNSNPNFNNPSLNNNTFNPNYFKHSNRSNNNNYKFRRNNIDKNNPDNDNLNDNNKNKMTEDKGPKITNEMITPKPEN